MIIPKGLINLDDIIKADKILGEYLWISNHGGRMFNSGITPISVLHKIKKKKIKLRSKLIVRYYIFANLVDRDVAVQEGDNLQLVQRLGHEIRFNHGYVHDLKSELCC